MLRTALAAMALSAVLASVSLAGDCACGIGGGGYSHAAWDGYCGCGGNSCGSGCGCKRCCFPLIHCTLHKIGRVVDFLIPDPCCKRRCHTGCGVACGQPACGIEPGCGVMESGGGMSDPFIDDHTPPTPTPAADPHAKARAWSNARMMTYPKAAPTPAPKPMPMKTASAPKVKSVAKASKAPGKSVLKVAYDEEPLNISDDAPPAAPASIREAASEPAIMSSAVRFAAKPVVTPRRSETPANPLRP